MLATTNVLSVFSLFSKPVLPPIFSNVLVDTWEFLLESPAVWVVCIDLLLSRPSSCRIDSIEFSSIRPPWLSCFLCSFYLVGLWSSLRLYLRLVVCDDFLSLVLYSDLFSSLSSCLFYDLLLDHLLVFSFCLFF